MAENNELRVSFEMSVKDYAVLSNFILSMKHMLESNAKMGVTTLYEQAVVAQHLVEANKRFK